MFKEVNIERTGIINPIMEKKVETMLSSMSNNGTVNNTFTNKRISSK